MFNYGEDMMKQWSENWEKMMGSQLEKMVTDKKFVGEMAKAISATMSGKAFYSKMIDQNLASMNLPSRSDVVKIMQKLTDVEERLVDLTEKYEDFAEEAEEREERLMAKIEKLENLLSGKAAAKPAAPKAKPVVEKKPTAKKAVAKPAVKKPVAKKKVTKK